MMNTAIVEASFAITSTAEALESIDMTMNSKIAAVVAAATTAAIEYGGGGKELIAAAHRAVCANSSSLLKEVRRQIDAMAEAARAS